MQPFAIEDDIDIAELEREYLHLHGYEGEIVQDGLLGLKKALIGIKAHIFDIIWGKEYCGDLATVAGYRFNS